SADIAEAMASHVPFDAVHAVVAQSLLPFFWRSGALGCRTFDVFMTRLPLTRVHQLLDEASSHNPNLATLREYRASEWMVELEGEALAHARNILTPHSAIAKLFGKKALRLPWLLPETRKATHGRTIVFPGPTVARKGAYELRAAVEGLDCEL